MVDPISRKSNARTAQRAKQTLALRFAGEPWFRGVAIVPGAGGALALRVSVATSEEKAAREVPRQVEGVPVDILFIDGYQPRPATGGVEE
jgi:hypothetical protein